MQVSEAVSLYAIVNSWRRSSDLETTHHEDVRLDFSAVSDSHQLEAASDVLQILPDITHVAVWSETQSAHHLNTRNDSVFTESQPRTTISTDYSAFTFYQNYKSSQINWLLIKVFMCIRGVLCYSYMYFTRGTGCEVSWWVMSVCVSVCPRGYLRNHTRDLYQFFVDVAYVRGSVHLRHVDYRPHRLSAGKRWRECTTRAKCNLRLPCSGL